MEQPAEISKKNTLEEAIEDGKMKVEIHQREGVVRTNFTYQQNTYLNNSLRFADTKAGALVAANGLIAKFITDLTGNSAYLVDLLLKCSLVAVIVGIFYALFVVFPRSVESKEKGIIYWEHINNYDKDEYVQIVAEGEVTELLKKAIENNYSQAAIVTNKFKKLSRAFKVSIAGYSLVFAALVIKFFF